LEKLILSAVYSDGMGGMASHLHDCHQLLYIRQGSARVTVSGRTYQAGAGTMVLISRFEAHAIEVQSETYCRYTLQIDPQAVNRSGPEASRLLSLLVNRPAQFHHTVDLSGNTRVEPLLRQLVEERVEENTMGPELMELLFLELLVHVARACPELLENQGKHFHMVRQVQIYLENHFRERLSLERIARDHHISPSYLSHQFKQITGTPVMGYLLSCRLAEAKELLVHTQLEIAGVMEQSGFSDSSNFSRTFKAETGLTPSRFRSRFWAGEVENQNKTEEKS